MALSSFGGKPSAGGSGGSSGGAVGTSMLTKDVGESMLVPSPFKHPDFTDTGVEIANVQYPELYQRLNSGAKPVFYSDTGDVGSAIAEVRSSTKAAVASLEANGELLVIHANGIVTASTNGLTYTYRGKLPALYGITPDLFWSGMTTGTMVVKGTRILAVSTSRGFGAAWYSDDQGATWTVIQDSLFSDTLVMQSPYRVRPLTATTDYFFYVEFGGAKRVIRSADGITWEVIASPAITGAFVATYADPTTQTFMAFVSGQNVILSTQDNGATWTSAAAIATTTPTCNFCKFGADVYFATYVSSNQLFYKSSDGGRTWAASGTATAVGGAGMGNMGVCGGKLCCVGTQTFATNGKHIVSTNGSTWTLVTSPTQANGRYPQYYNNQLLFFRDHAIVGAEKPTISSDAATVTGTALTSDLIMPSAMNGSVVVVTPTRMLAFSSQTTDQYAYTDDGETWYSDSMPIAAQWTGGCYDPVTEKIYVTNATSLTFFESSDLGNTWSEITVSIPTCNASNSIPMVCGNVIAFVPNTITPRYPFLLSIPDAQGKRTQIRAGGTWSTVAGTTAARLVQFRDGFLTPSSTANSISMVQDAVRNSAVTRAIGIATTAGVIGANSTVCFMANAGSVAYSTQGDLITWAVKTLPIAQTWTAVVNLVGNQFLLIAAGSFKALLGDGISWEILDMSGISFDDFNSAAYFKGNVYVFSADKVTKASRSIPSNKRYVPTAISPVDGFKYVVRAKS